MQKAIGIGVLVVVCMTSIVVTRWAAKESNDFKWKYAPLVFTGSFVTTYIAIVLVCLFFWAVAWVGIVFRELLQWIFEGILYPFHWIF